MIDWMEYVNQAVTHQASDLFFVAGGPVCEKLDGKLCPMGSPRLLPEDTAQIIEGIYQTSQRPMNAFLQCGDDDFSFSIPGLARFRVNCYQQRGSMAAVIRIVSFDIPDWEVIGVPAQVMELANMESGLILVTGTAGSGKSTTQACIIDRINRSRNCHIVTLEDPIEYLHRHQKSIVSQREIAIDTQDYLSALRACVRQAPDVILLGEMRDPETIHTAMTAAETGHLVIATRHTKGAVNAIDRVIDAFPSNQQAQVRIQLGAVLRTVVSQQLVPDVQGNLVPACEILQLTPAARSMIRDNKTHQLHNVIAAGAKEGMLTMDQSLTALCKAGRIAKETALHYCDNPEQLQRNL